MLRSSREDVVAVRSVGNIYIYVYRQLLGIPVVEPAQRT